MYLRLKRLFALVLCCKMSGHSVSGDGIFFDSQVWTGAKNLWVPICCKFVIVTACFYKVLKKYTHTISSLLCFVCRFTITGWNL